MFFEDVRSERRLMEIAADRLSNRWYLGYDLNEPLPDHSSLTRIRERYGLEIFRGFFERIVQMCLEAKLVRGEELFFDSTKVKANVDIDSLASRFLVETHLSGLFEEPWIPEEGSEAEPPASIELDTLPTSENEALVAANTGKSDWISRAGGQDRTFNSPGHEIRRTRKHLARRSLRLTRVFFNKLVRYRYFQKHSPKNHENVLGWIIEPISLSAYQNLPQATGYETV